MQKIKVAQGRAWQEIAESALDLGRRGQTREALSMLQQAIEDARLADDRQGQVIALNGAALMQSIRGDFWSSLASSMDAFSMASAIADRPGMAHAMTMLAGALLLMTPIDSEISLLRSALEIAEAEQDLRLQIRVHNLLGILLGDLKRFDQAEVHLGLALVLADCGIAGSAPTFDRWRVMANIANLSRKRAEAAARAGDREEARERCESGLALIGRVEAHCNEAGKMPILLDAYRVAGMMRAVQGEADMAHDKYALAWKLAIDCKLRSALPALGVDIGRMLIKRGQHDAAEAALVEALREAGLYRPSPKAPALCAHMAAIAASRGDTAAEAGWRADGLKARADFEALKREARRQLARVAESLGGLDLAVRAGTVSRV